jgi:hypothetical protein
VERAAIDADLVAGVPFRKIAERTGTSVTALHRHKGACLPAALVKATEAAEVVRADDLLAKARAIEEEARRLGRKAEQQGDLRAALLACRELARICELMGRLVGAFHEEPQKPGLVVQVMICSPDGHQQAVILPTGETSPMRPA